MMRFLFVDKIENIIETHPQVIRGTKYISENEFYLYPDKNGRMMFVPSLIGEALGQLAAWNVMQRNDFINRPVAGVVGRAQMIRPAYVGETLVLESTIDSLESDAVYYHSVACIDGTPVFYVDGALGPLLPMDEFISPELAREQYACITPGRTVRPHIPGIISDFNADKVRRCDADLFYFDQITDFESDNYVVARKQISLNAPYFPDHFPRKPVLPLTVLLECQLNLVHEFAVRSNWPSDFRVHEINKIKMSAFVQPGSQVEALVTLKKSSSVEKTLQIQTKVENKRVCVLEMIVRRDNHI